LNAPPTDKPEEPSRAAQAATWLLCFKSPSFGPDSCYPDVASRNAAFLDWLQRSPANLLLFMELTELDRRLRRLDPSTLAEIRSLISTAL